MTQKKTPKKKPNMADSTLRLHRAHGERLDVLEHRSREFTRLFEEVCDWVEKLQAHVKKLEAKR